MKTVELTTPIGFVDLCRFWPGDAESLVHALIERDVDCYLPASDGSTDPGTGAGQYELLEELKVEHFETVCFDYDDIHLLMLFERVRNNERVTVADARANSEVRFGPKQPNLEKWRKSVATAVKIIDHYLQDGHKLPQKKIHIDEWNELISEWNQLEGGEPYYLLDDAREELWRGARKVKAVTNQAYRKRKPLSKLVL